MGGQCSNDAGAHGEQLSAETGRCSTGRSSQSLASDGGTGGSAASDTHAADSMAAGLVSKSATISQSQERDVFAELVQMASVPSSPSRGNSPDLRTSRGPDPAAIATPKDAGDPFCDFVRLVGRTASRESSPPRSEAAEKLSVPLTDASPAQTVRAPQLGTALRGIEHCVDRDRGTAGCDESGLDDLRQFLQLKAQCVATVRLSTAERY